MNRRTILRFMLVGLLGTLVDFFIFAVLHLQLGLPTLLANSLSYSAGILNNYILHSRWTFANRPRRPAGIRFSQFVGVSLSALVINNLIVLLLLPLLARLIVNPTLGAYAAKIAAVGVGMLWNFLANHLWTFRAAPARPAHGELKLS